MGILLSFLFPYRYMYAEQPVSSSSTSSASSSTDGESDLDLLGLTPLLDSPAAADQAASLTSPDDAISHHANPLPAPDTPSFSRHVLGLGLSSFRTSLSSPSNLPSIREGIVPPEPESVSQPVPRGFSPEPSSPIADASPPGSPPPGSGRPLESLAPSSPLLSHVEASAAHASFFPPSETNLDQRATATGAGASTGNGGANGLSLRLEIPSPPHHLGSNAFVHSGPAFSPPPLAGAAASPHQQEPPMLAASSQGSQASLDLAQEMPFGLNATAATGDPTLNLDFAEFDLEGASTLERIYLFSRSRASFQRVFITHALPGYLRSALRRRHDAVDTNGSPAGVDGQSEPDEISPAEAVEYVLPLLNGLAMDEGELLRLF
jgi:serine/threonine-protein phosphatase 4 regulatory subunit 1